MARATLHSTYLTGRARTTRAILPKPVTSILDCQNGSSHSCAQVMPQAVLEYDSSHFGTQEMQLTMPELMAQAIIALKSSNWQLCGQNGCSSSCTQVMQLAGPEWLKPLWHSNIVPGTALTILALNYSNWQCQNGSSHSGT